MEQKLNNMAGEECILCYEHLAIPVFERNLDNDIKVEGMSTRLQCGHAYHTRCILQSFQHRTVCPLCNVHGQQEEEQNGWWNQGRIEMEGRCIQIMETVKKDPEVRTSIRDYKTRVKELMGIKKTFDTRTKQFKAELRKELEIDEKLKTIIKVQGATTRLFARKAKSEGTLYTGAHSFLPAYKISKFLFGDMRFFRWRMARVFS